MGAPKGVSFGFRVSSFGFRVSGWEFRVSSFGFRVSSWSLEFRVGGAVRSQVLAVRLCGSLNLEHLQLNVEHLRGFDEGDGDEVLESGVLGAEVLDFFDVLVEDDLVLVSVRVGELEQLGGPVVGGSEVLAHLVTGEG